MKPAPGQQQTGLADFRTSAQSRASGNQCCGRAKSALVLLNQLRCCLHQDPSKIPFDLRLLRQFGHGALFLPENHPNASSARRPLQNNTPLRIFRKGKTCRPRSPSPRMRLLRSQRTLLPVKRPRPRTRAKTRASSKKRRCPRPRLKERKGQAWRACSRSTGPTCFCLDGSKIFLAKLTWPFSPACWTLPQLVGGLVCSSQLFFSFGPGAPHDQQAGTPDATSGLSPSSASQMWTSTSPAFKDQSCGCWMPSAALRRRWERPLQPTSRCRCPPRPQGTALRKCSAILPWRRGRSPTCGWALGIAC